MESAWATNPSPTQAKVADICATLGAMAAGYWRLDRDDDRLVQVAFVPGLGLDHAVGRQFAAQTVTVALGESGLGIVVAALTGRPAVSRVAELSAESGSGHWLRAFGANRSVAVPIKDTEGWVRGVVSVALPQQIRDTDEAIADRLREALS